MNDDPTPPASWTMAPVNRDGSSSLLLVDEILSVVRHETNQPLAAVVANGNAALRWLGRSEPDLAEARRAIERAVSEATRASELLARTREFAPPRRNVVEFDLNSAVIAAGSLTSHAAAERGSGINLDLADRLRPVVGDPERIELLVSNLILSVLRGSGNHVAGSPVQVSTGSANDMAFVKVSVDGVDVSLEAATGQDLALAVARNIAIAHEGSISTGLEGDGMVMTFKLPVLR
ncbi:histidine kinase dimerization/phospho-acceptor domain-containing protein [Sphingomonas sp. DT-51]|uniref:histidine kinase dimerization/phospho-acceptor domain-containing protein n=1 Tax=Sphingomonas sp. DT-51 TaxID=3396165 RepID=UPI003F1D4FF0